MKRKYLNTILVFLLLLNLTTSLKIRSETKLSKLSSTLFEYNKIQVSFSETSPQNTDSHKSELYSYYDKKNSIIKFSFEKNNTQPFLAKGVYESTRFKEG